MRHLEPYCLTVSVAPLELVRERARARSGPVPPAAATGARLRVVDGALACIAGHGVGGTTLDDVARAAGCSRATVYRLFPGGKDAVLGAVVDTEVSRFFHALALRMGAAASVEDVLVGAMNEAAVQVTGHRALQYLLAHEPELVLSQLAFARMDEVLAVTCGFTTPFLGRWLDQAESRRVAEWAARIVVSYLMCPADGVDLTDVGQVRRLVRLFVVPGVQALGVPGGGPARRRGGGHRAPPRRSIFAVQPNKATSKGEAP